MDQAALNTIAETLDVKYGVIDNLKYGKYTYEAHISLTNYGDVPLSYEGKWKIYFCHNRMIEPDVLRDRNEVELEKYGILFTHINGCLFTLEPLKSFKTLKKGDSVNILFHAQHYSVSRTDALPNWYIDVDGLKPRLIKSTCGTDLDYVEPFDKPEKWKRFNYQMDSGIQRFDLYNPYTPQERYEKQKVEDLKKSGKHLIPTPVDMKINMEETLDLGDGEWTIRYQEGLENEATFLKDKLTASIDNLQMKTGIPKDATHIIAISLSNITLLDDLEDSPEGYQVLIKPQYTRIEIHGNSSAGIFYGVQSLLSLCDNTSLPSVTIVDAPRYKYRGMHVDVSRNFHSKQEILKLLDIMAMYKLNKFHFHLTDDEGWRLEIPGLEELTTVGGRRGHDLSEKTCILPMLGSGPDFDTSGTGHYSVEDYREILQYAKARHIEVIPEIDMPGHSHAAIKAMQARYLRYKEKGEIEKAKEYLVSPLHTNGFHSVQMFSENAMDPGMESTYKFVDKVVMEVKRMHEDIAPLKTFHFGGDEVPYKAWEGSDACEALVKSKTVKFFSDLMEYFVKRVSNIVAKHKLYLGAWQDGVILDDMSLEPLKRSNFQNEDVLVYAWQNVWETGLSGCAYKLANTGYKTVLSQGTHLYFDHPYEPDPEERGLCWATRCVDTQKVFGFLPDNIYWNADYKLTGEQIKYCDLMKNKEDHEPLKKKENIIGMQGQLWSELVRTADEMECMIFPRLIALAERAWHKASWETVKDEKSRSLQRKADWCMFANCLGYKELYQMDKIGVAYHLPPPGARVEDGKLTITCAYPGLPLFYSLDSGSTWVEYNEQIKVTPGVTVIMETRSTNKERKSRPVKLTV